jgi:hypothetical protein
MHLCTLIAICIFLVLYSQMRSSRRVFRVRIRIAVRQLVDPAADCQVIKVFVGQGETYCYYLHHHHHLDALFLITVLNKIGKLCFLPHYDEVSITTRGINATLESRETIVSKATIVSDPIVTTMI